MNQLINDFLNAYQKPGPRSFFDGDREAIEISGRMSKNARRKFKRYHVVPSAFYVYLRDSRIINKDAKIPQGGSTLGDLLDFLRWYDYETEQARSAGEYLYRQIIKTDLYPLRYINDQMFGLSDHLLHESRCTVKRRRKILNDAPRSL